LFIPTNQPLQAELSHFIACVNGLATPRITGEDALNALRVVWKIQDALGFARTISTPDAIEKKAA
jgi:predicted dehydrogenase